MARIVEIGGVRTGIPGVRNKTVTTEGSNPVSTLAKGRVGVFAECAGTIEPKKLFRISSGSDAILRKKIVSGVGFDACRMIFDPSLDDQSLVPGASEIYFWRVNPATQGTSSIQNGSAADLLDLTTVGYGLDQTSSPAR